MNTTTEMLIETKLANAKKSSGTAYLLLLFLGGIGAHRFYLGKNGTAWAQVVLMILGIPSLGLMWLPLGLWLIIDLMLLPSFIRDGNNDIRREIRRVVMLASDD